MVSFISVGADSARWSAVQDSFKLWIAARLRAALASATNRFYYPLNEESLGSLRFRSEPTMLGRTQASGYEPNRNAAWSGMTPKNYRIS